MLAYGFGQGQPLYQNKLDDIANHIANDLIRAGKTRLAVYDLPHTDGRLSEFSQVFADQLSQSLQRANTGLELLDRANLRRLIDEHELVKKGLTDPNGSEHLQELNKIIAADVLITGRLTPQRDAVTVSIRALDLPTLRVLSSGSLSVARTPSIDELISRLLPGGQK